MARHGVISFHLGEQVSVHILCNIQATKRAFSSSVQRDSLSMLIHEQIHVVEFQKTPQTKKYPMLLLVKWHSLA